MIVRARRVRYVVVGIGVDVNLAASELPVELRGVATSLRIEAGHPVSRAGLAAALLRQLDFDYARILSGEFDEVADEWVRQCSTIGKEVVIQMGSQRINGRAEALDSDGALLVRTGHGRLERIVGGDVSLAAKRG